MASVAARPRKYRCSDSFVLATSQGCHTCGCGVFTQSTQGSDLHCPRCCSSNYVFSYLYPYNLLAANVSVMTPKAINIAGIALTLRLKTDRSSITVQVTAFCNTFFLCYLLITAFLALGVTDSLCREWQVLQRVV